jgi:tRNA(fMet)-specific endonuclease VapC
VTPRFLLDTNIVSEPLRPAPDPTILARLHEHQAEIAIAAVVWHELWFGCLRLPRSAKREAIERYLQSVISPTIPILAYDGRAAEWHSAERARLTSLGRTPAFADGQIAAIARTNNLILVTRNVDDFAPFEGLQIAPWQDPPTEKHP